MKRTGNIVIVGGSAGSFGVVKDLVRSLKRELRGTLILVVHRMGNEKSELAKVLSGKGQNAVHEAKHMEEIEHKIYLAPADYHLIVDEEGRFHFDFSEKVLCCRPSIDVTFESFSSVYQNNIIGVVLSGANEDGAEGASIIEQRKGFMLVQHPQSAEMKEMPLATLNALENDYRVLDREEIIEEISNYLL